MHASLYPDWSIRLIMSFSHSPTSPSFLPSSFIPHSFFLLHSSFLSSTTESSVPVVSPADPSSTNPTCTPPYSTSPLSIGSPTSSSITARCSGLLLPPLSLGQSCLCVTPMKPCHEASGASAFLWRTHSQPWHVQPLSTSPSFSPLPFLSLPSFLSSLPTSPLSFQGLVQQEFGPSSQHGVWRKSWGNGGMNEM